MWVNKLSSNKIINVLFTWEVNERLKKYIQKNLFHLKGVNLIFPAPLSEEELLRIAPTADILIGWRVKDETKGTDNR